MVDNADVCPAYFSLAVHYTHDAAAPSEHYEPPTPAQHAMEDTRMPVDGPGSRCIIPGCQYPAYYNVAEQELMEYCGHGHELCVSTLWHDGQTAKLN